MLGKYDLVVVGGGAAGLLAGCLGSDAGYKICIIDRLQKPGRKILVSGGGRCNLTKLLSPGELINAYYDRNKFVRNAIYNFDAGSLIAYFRLLRLETVIEKDSGVYPASNKAADVYAALRGRLRENNVEIITERRVDEVLHDAGAVYGVRTGSDILLSERVLLAAGGKGRTELGADGSGFAIAEKAGHNIVSPVGGLVGLTVASPLFSGLAGTVVNGCTVECAGKKSMKFSGDILFTHKGLSGPVILDISRYVEREIYRQKKAEIVICWGKDKKFWEAEFARYRRESGGINVENMLNKYFPRKFVSSLLKFCGINEKIRFAELKKQYMLKIISCLAEYKTEIGRLEPLSGAMVACGGVDISEINSKTLESKLVTGLYFAGEVIDVDGQCGGYNLQWAFSSAALAVKFALAAKK